jgi:histidine triad (HIT) family protein
MPSIFSRIARGEASAAKVYEDEHTLAFMDINPAGPGHVLVICKEEYADIFSIPPDVLVRVTHTVQRIALALRTALRPDGLNIIQNNGASAGQSVFHYHVHLIPRWEGDGVVRQWLPRRSDPSELRSLADRIRQALGAEHEGR